MSTPFIAQIVMFGGNFAPRSWAFCQGQILSIAQNTALFALLGTTYGGNGQTTFALPDLRGRVPVGTGQGPGLPATNLGQMAGSPTVTLISTQMPAHNHATQVVSRASSGAATDTLPNNNFLAADNQYSSASDAQMNPTAVQVTVGVAGGSQPHENMQPYLGINFIIAMEGIFPSRN
jgi:microcystin-dependent protein